MPIKDPKSAVVYEGSFVAGVIGDSSDYKVGGGDVAVQFNSSKATQALMTYLAGSDAAKSMVSTGSFSSANKNLAPSVAPWARANGRSCRSS